MQWSCLYVDGTWRDGEGLKLLERTPVHKERSFNDEQSAECGMKLFEENTYPIWGTFSSISQKDGKFGALCLWR